MYQNNNSYSIYTQYQLLNSLYQRGVCARLFEGAAYHQILNQSNLLAHSLYCYPPTLSMQEEYLRRVLLKLNQDNFNRTYYQMTQTPLELNNFNIPNANANVSTQMMELTSQPKQTIDANNGNNDKGITDSTNRSNFIIEKTLIPIEDPMEKSGSIDRMSINSFNYNIEKKQLISHKRNRDNPNDPDDLSLEIEPKPIQSRKPKKKKTQKERANELLEDSLLLFIKKKVKAKGKEPNWTKAEKSNGKDKDKNNSDNALNEIEEESNNVNDTETDSTTTKIIFHSSSYKPTANTTDFMKYNFNFEVNAQYKTEKLIINFEDQHAIFNKEDFFELMNGNDISDSRICHYNRSISKLPRKVWSYSEYNEANFNTIQSKFYDNVMLLT